MSELRKRMIRAALEAGAANRKPPTPHACQAALDALDAAEAEIERLRAALQFYADPNTYDFPEFDMICVDPFTPIALDEGSIARAALIDKEVGE